MRVAAEVDRDERRVFHVAVTRPRRSLTVVADQASSTSPLGYQWTKNGKAIAGATNATYAIGAASTNDLGAYDAVIVDALCGAVVSLGEPVATNDNCGILLVTNNAPTSFGPGTPIGSCCSASRPG